MEAICHQDNAAPDPGGRSSAVHFVDAIDQQAVMGTCDSPLAVLQECNNNGLVSMQQVRILCARAFVCWAQAGLAQDYFD